MKSFFEFYYFSLSGPVLSFGFRREREFCAVDRYGYAGSAVETQAASVAIDLVV